MAVGGRRSRRRRSRKARSVARPASRRAPRRARRVSKKKRRSNRGRKVRRSRRVRQMRGGARMGFGQPVDRPENSPAMELMQKAWEQQDALAGRHQNFGLSLEAYVKKIRGTFKKVFGKSQTQVLDDIYELIKDNDYKLWADGPSPNPPGPQATALEHKLMQIFVAKKPRSKADPTLVSKVNFEPAPRGGPPRAFDLFATTCLESPTFGGFCPFYSSDDFILLAPPNQSDMMGTNWIEGTDAGFTHLMCVPVNKDSEHAKTMNDLLPLDDKEKALLESRKKFIEEAYAHIRACCGKTLGEYIDEGGDHRGIIQKRMKALGLGRASRFSDYVINTFQKGKDGGFATNPKQAAENMEVVAASKRRGSSQPSARWPKIRDDDEDSVVPWGLNPDHGMFKMGAEDLTHKAFVALWEVDGVVLEGVQTPDDNSQLVSHCHVVKVPRGVPPTWPKKALGKGAYVDPMLFCFVGG